MICQGKSPRDGDGRHWIWKWRCWSFKAILPWKIAHMVIVIDDLWIIMIKSGDFWDSYIKLPESMELTSGKCIPSERFGGDDFRFALDRSMRIFHLRSPVFQVWKHIPIPSCDSYSPVRDGIYRCNFVVYDHMWLSKHLLIGMRPVIWGGRKGMNGTEILAGGILS